MTDQDENAREQYARARSEREREYSRRSSATDEGVRAANERARSSGSRERFQSKATTGGEHVIVRRRVSKKQAYAETPAFKIAAPPRQRRLPSSSRLGSPAALLMLGGLVLIYVALHGWDKKYGTFGGAFAGVANIPSKASGASAGAKPPSQSGSAAPPAGGNA